MNADAHEGATSERGGSATVNRRPSIEVLQNMLRKIPRSPSIHLQQDGSSDARPAAPARESEKKRNGGEDAPADLGSVPLPEFRPSVLDGPENAASADFGFERVPGGFSTSRGGSASWLDDNPSHRENFFKNLPSSGPVPQENLFKDLQSSGSISQENLFKDLQSSGSIPQENLFKSLQSSGSIPRENLLQNLQSSGSISQENLLKSLPSSGSIQQENLFKNLHSSSSGLQDLLRASPEDFSLAAPSRKAREKPGGLWSAPLWPSSNTAEDPAGNPFGSRFLEANAEKFPRPDKLSYWGLSGSDPDASSPSPDVWSPVATELFRDGGEDVPARFGPSDAPQGSKRGILQPTPFSQARNLGASPDSSPTRSDLGALSRRPPKPLPRFRAPKPGKPPVPEKSLKPVFTPEPAGPPKPPPKTFKARPAETQEAKELPPPDYDVFEDVLLIGQEKCVEDWPEDSPQSRPDFKPWGKLRLRRESLKFKVDSEDGATGEDQDDAGLNKRKDRKSSLLSRGSSKDKLGDDARDGRSWTLPHQGKTSKDNFHDANFKGEDGEQSWSDGKKKPLKNKVNKLLRRASTGLVQRHPGVGGKDDDLLKKRIDMKESTLRWHSQDAMLEGGIAEEEAAQAPAWWDEGDASISKGKKKLKMKFASSRARSPSGGEQPQGAQGYTPRKDSKERQGPFWSAGDGWQERSFEGADEMKKLHSGSQDVAPFHPRQNSLAAEQPDYDGLNAANDYIAFKSKSKAPVPLPRRKAKLGDASPAPGEPATFGHPAFARTACSDNWPDEDDCTPSERPHGDPMLDYDYGRDEPGLHKQLKTKRKVFRKHKAKNKAWEGSVEDVAVNHLSEAAQAEWIAAQKDERAAAGLAGDEGEGDGDTDSLMEWWNTVEKWDEVPSDQEESKEPDESRSFAALADKVSRGLRVFNKVFTERAEVLWQHVVRLHALADHLGTFHQKAKAAGITGSTTAAVGGVTAIAGLALAPFTFGASLIVTAVGVGVATAGGITSASATISDNVNHAQERKKVEAVLQEYEFDFGALAEILHFVNHGLYKLRGHPFLRSGTQHYSEDWEVRKAVQVIGLVDSPVMRAVEVTEANLQLVRALQGGMDKYFKDNRNLKRGFKKEVVARIKQAADTLNDGVVELNAIREELQKALGHP